MTVPTLTVELGRITGWILGEDELGVDTTLAGVTAWDDITSAVTDVSIRRGRQHELDRVEAGTARLTLMNQNDDFNPLNTDGPYYPDIRPMIPMRIRATIEEPEPPDISGLMAWYKADAIVGLSDTDPVATWEDSHTTNLDLTQGTAGNRPTYRTNILNGLPVVRFDGTDDRLESGMSTSQKPVTLFVVASVDDFGNIHTVQGASSNGGLQWRINTGQTVSLLKQDIAGIGTSTDALSAATFYILAATYDGSGNFAFYTNGAAKGTGTNSQTLTASTLSLGRHPTAGELFDGDIAEFFAFDTVLSTDDLNSMGTYLANKWGLSW